MKRTPQGLTSGFLVTLAVAGMLYVPAPAQSQETLAHVDATRLTCRDLKGLLKREGVMIVYSDRAVAPFNLGYYLFGGADRRTGGRFRERFVSNRRYCQFNETLTARPVATADKKSCYLNICADRTERDNGI